MGILNSFRLLYIINHSGKLDLSIILYLSIVLCMNSLGISLAVRWLRVHAPNMGPVCCSMSGSNSCFLTCIRFLRRQVRWSGIPISFRIFPACCDLHSQRFSIVSEEVDAFLEFPRFFYDPGDVGNLISGSSAFSKPSFYVCMLSVHVLLKPGLKDSEYYLATM